MTRWGNGRGGRPWRRLRDRVLARDHYTCQQCGRISDTDMECDHVVPTSKGGTDDERNLQALCRDCHAIKTAGESDGNASILPRWLPAPLVPVTVVCGPAGAGKSTYVRERAQPGDLVLDTDEIAARLAGTEIYRSPPEYWRNAMRERNERLAELSRASKYRMCWLVATASTHNAREFWRAYASNVVVINPGTAVCVERIRKDARRPQSVKDRQIASVYEWESGIRVAPLPSRHAETGADGWPVAQRL